MKDVDLVEATPEPWVGSFEFSFAIVSGRRVLDHRNPAPRFGLRPAEYDRPRRLSFAYYSDVNATA